MAKGEDLQKPKKGGMVIVIGVGAKPKKKGDVKKAEEGDSPRRQRRRRGRGGERATLRRYYNRLRSGRINLDELLERRKVDPDEFYGEFRRRTGENYNDYLKAQTDKFDVQGLLDELASKASGKRIAEAKERQSSAGKQKRTQENIYYGLLNTPVNLLERKGIDPDRFRRAVQRMKDKGEKVDKNTYKMLINRFSDEEAARDYKELPDEAFRLTPRGPDKRDHQEVEDHEYRNMRRILSALSEQYGQEAIDAMARRYATQGYTGAPVGYEGERRKPKRGVSVSHLPSTIFHDEFAPADSRMSSPQEEEYEGVTFDPRSRGIQGGGRQHQEFIMRALSPETINVMDEAFALLKGNPDMRDAEGRAINHPAAMVYDSIANEIQMRHENPFDDRVADDESESASLLMEHLREDKYGEAADHAARMYRQGMSLPEIVQGMKDLGYRSSSRPLLGESGDRFALRQLKNMRNRVSRQQEKDEGQARGIRRRAREQTSNTMNNPNPPHSGRNFGIRQSTGTDVRMEEDVMRQPKNVMDLM